MKTFNLKSVDFELVAAFVTWLCVASLTVYSQLRFETPEPLRLSAVIVLMLTFILSFLYSTSDRLAFDVDKRKLHILLQILATFMLYFIVPINFMPILATIWCAQLPRTFSFGQSIAIAGVVCIPIYFAIGEYWHSGSGFVSAVVYWMFNCFAVVTMDRVVKEEQAREKATELNRELLATQSLLTEATRQSERLRISRNIHDVVGHHLTALTLNLQVAAHLSNGKAKATIDQCHSVAKSLLSDVRDSVSEMRDKSVIDVPGALNKLADNTPSLELHFDFDDKLNISEVTVAEVVVRVFQEALTNALKHSQAENMWVTIKCDEADELLMEIKNDGCTNAVITPGNGLTGMSERVAQLKGQLVYAAAVPYFQITVRCPNKL